MLTKVSTEKVPAAIDPYSQGIIAGDFLFVSWQVPKDVLCEVEVIAYLK